VPPTWTPGIDEFVTAAAVILDVEEDAIRRLPGLNLAESALAAPFAGLGEHEAYPELADKATVLIERIARNHPLPDGNKRVALALAILFVERNGLRWGAPAHDRDVEMVERIASGSADRAAIRQWIDERTDSAAR
jgi:death-on-curing protein